MYMMQKSEYVANNDSQLRITLPKYIAISQKLRITFCFLNSTLGIIKIYSAIKINIIIKNRQYYRNRYDY